MRRKPRNGRRHNCVTRRSGGGWFNWVRQGPGRNVLRETIRRTVGDFFNTINVNTEHPAAAIQLYNTLNKSLKEKGITPAKLTNMLNDEINTQYDKYTRPSEQHRKEFSEIVSKVLSEVDDEKQYTNPNRGIFSQLLWWGTEKDRNDVENGDSQPNQGSSDSQYDYDDDDGTTPGDSNDNDDDGTTPNDSNDNHDDGTTPGDSNDNQQLPNNIGVFKNVAKEAARSANKEQTGRTRFLQDWTPTNSFQEQEPMVKPKSGNAERVVDTPTNSISASSKSRPTIQGKNPLKTNRNSSQVQRESNSGSNVWKTTRENLRKTPTESAPYDETDVILEYPQIHTGTYTNEGDISIPGTANPLLNATDSRYRRGTKGGWRARNRKYLRRKTKRRTTRK